MGFSFSTALLTRSNTSCRGAPRKCVLSRLHHLCRPGTGACASRLTPSLSASERYYKWHNSYNLYALQKAVLSLSFSPTSTCQYPSTMSKVENQQAGCPRSYRSEDGVYVLPSNCIYLLVVHTEAMSTILFLHKQAVRRSNHILLLLLLAYWYLPDRLPDGRGTTSVNIVCNSVGVTKLTLIQKDVGILQEQLKELFLLLSCKVTCTFLDLSTCRVEGDIPFSG